MYKCEPCNFSTNRSRDLSRHNESNKHMNNMIKCTEKYDINYDKMIMVANCDTCTRSDVSFFVGNGSIKTSKNATIENRTHDNKNIIIDLENINDFTLSANKNFNNIEKQKYACECGKEYSFRQCLYRHRKTCQKREYIKEMGELKKKVAQMDVLENKISLMSEKIQLLESNSQSIIETPTLKYSNNKSIYSNNAMITTNSNNTINNTNNNQKIINVYNYVTKNYTNAEPIKMLNKQDVTKLLTIEDKNTEHSIEDFIIFNQSKRSLNQFIGDFIIKEYKKEDPNEQQIWATDVSRLSFLVRQVLNKTDKTWLKDMKGTCLGKHIITPIFKEIKKMMQDHIKKLDSVNYDELSISELEKLETNGALALKIIYDINQKNLHPKVLSHIVSSFQLE